jgi:periplasmic protein TonB
MIVGADGAPTDVWVREKLGLGLDQKAVEALRQWRFQAALKDGQAVPVLVTIEVGFHLH